MRLKFLIVSRWLALVSIIILISGCATWQHTTSESKPIETKSLAVAQILKFDDVPVPFGFTMLEKESFAFQNDLTRVGLLKYAGRANIDQVVNFYKEQMPLNNWEALNIVEYEKRVLNFDKKDESCIVTIERAAVGKTVITIAISPKSRPMKVETKKKE